MRAPRRRTTAVALALAAALLTVVTAADPEAVVTPADAAVDVALRPAAADGAAVAHTAAAGVAPDSGAPPLDVATADAVAPDAAVAAAPPVVTTAAAAPTPDGDAEARAREALAKANAVLALRRAGLLPGSGALPREMDAKTVAAVNAAAPTFAAEGGAHFRPQLTQSVGGGSEARNASTAAAPRAPATAAVAAAPAPPATAGRWAGQDAWDRAPVGAMTDYVRNRPGAVGGSGVALSPATEPTNSPGFNFAVNGKPVVSSPSARATTTSPTTNGTVAANALIGELGPLRADESTGSIIQFLFGMRISTPFFGTGFNFCVDRYFGSFPKVGIVIPNAAAWLLPDVAGLLGPTLNATVALPTPGAGLPKGARADPTSDGFVVWLPSIQPLYISNFGFRYGLQIAQLFGMDFGFGVLKIGCRVDFVRV